MALMETNKLFKTELSKKKHKLTQQEVERLKEISLEILLDIIKICEERHIPYMLGGGTALGAIRHKGFIPWDDDIDINVPRRDIDRLLDALNEVYGEKYYIEAPVRTEGYLSSFVQVHKNGTVFREFLAQDIDKCGVKVDIFPIENTYNSKFKRKLHGRLCEFGLLMLSCYRMYAWRGEYKALAKGNLKASVLVRVKGFIGMLASPFHKMMYRGVQNVFQMCKDEKTDYVVIPSGRGHFFGELYLRRTFMPLTKKEFEGHEMMITADYDHYLKKLYGNYMELPDESKREYHVLYQLKI